MHCIFCNDIAPEQHLLETEHFKLVFDIDPIQQGHMLVISKAHVQDRRELTAAQIQELFELECCILEVLAHEFSIKSATVIQNNGPIQDEGTHFHTHIIPRYEDDQFWDNQQVVQRELSNVELRLKLGACADIFNQPK